MVEIQGPLKQLSDLASEVHAQIQRDFEDINPVIGVTQQMRSIGIAADVMTVDCLVTNKRLLLILKDAEPGLVTYQYCWRDLDPSDLYEQIALQELTSQMLYDWIIGYFRTDKS